MAKHTGKLFAITAAAIMLPLTLGTGSAQTAAGHAAASTQDTQFLGDLAQDSNFEIKTSKLALQNSKSPDVKRYATMVIHDHTMLEQKIKGADRSAKRTATPPTDMASNDQSTYENLKGLKGDAFDQAYIKELIKGNDHIQQEEKSEASDSTLPPVKNLAIQSVSIDTKHSEAAKKLAQTHHVQS